MMSDEEFTFGMVTATIESKNESIAFLRDELDKKSRLLQQAQDERAMWVKERKGLCRAVTRANKARNAMGRWTVAIQNENDLLRLMLKDRGINADFMWKAKRAMEVVERVRKILGSPHPGGYAGMVEDTLEVINDES